MMNTPSTVSVIMDGKVRYTGKYTCFYKNTIYVKDTTNLMLTCLIVLDVLSVSSGMHSLHENG